MTTIWRWTYPAMDGPAELTYHRFLMRRRTRTLLAALALLAMAAGIQPPVHVHLVDGRHHGHTALRTQLGDHPAQAAGELLAARSRAELRPAAPAPLHRHHDGCRICRSPLLAIWGSPSGAVVRRAPEGVSATLPERGLLKRAPLFFDLRGPPAFG